MKVAYFIGSLNRGGTEMLTLDICRKKDYASYEMILIYRNDGELTDEFRATGVPMFRIKPKGFAFGYLGEIRRLLKKEKVNLLHAQTLMNGAVGVFCTLFTNLRTVTSFHGLLDTFYKRVLRHINIWWADETVFVSKYVRNWYIQHTLFCNKEKCNVVYNGICLEKYGYEYPKPDVLKSEEKRLKFGCVGNFVAERTHMVICKSIKRLDDLGIKQFEFYFVGKRVEGEEKCYDGCVEYCEKNHLMDRVHFLGSRGDVIAILQHLDGFVYSTAKDTFGIAVVEAMVAGLPVVVNDWEVMKEVSHEGKYACLFKTDNEADCCEKMKILIDNIETCRSKAKHQVEEVSKLYSIENHIDGLKTVYDKCFV